ncbi:MAG: hypothetical protein AMJ95_13995 [Omnitrophica WOR_2 bacterium SM23_72]|nr:MAG: hypothetical protein AMJ95_13995 [Omnitrophica WOR_2 bacterium SM23_72]
MKDKKGFTLIEVMIAASVLALGAVLIYEAFFIALDTFSYSEHYLDVAPLANERLWQAQENLTRLGHLGDLPTHGELTHGGKRYHWELSSLIQDEADSDKLFQVDLTFFWQEGRRKAKVTRSTLALYKEKE